MPMLKDPTDPKSPEVIVARSISMMVSTHGGSAADMFSILDVMDMVKTRTCDIETFGIGKVMFCWCSNPRSRDQRKKERLAATVGSCHNVMAGSHGTIFSMENELEEIKWIQRDT